MTITIELFAALLVAFLLGTFFGTRVKDWLVAIYEGTFKPVHPHELPQFIRTMLHRQPDPLPLSVVTRLGVHIGGDSAGFMQLTEEQWSQLREESAG